jgi:hypothetical protein
MKLKSLSLGFLCFFIIWEFKVVKKVAQQSHQQVQVSLRLIVLL